MAIEFEEKSKFNWKGLLAVVLTVAAVFGAAYFLFFAPVPAIEVIVSPAVQSTSELSQIQLDALSVANRNDFRSLRHYIRQPSVGQVGRENPFIKY